jgi:hypothetical protein
MNGENALKTHKTKTNNFKKQIKKKRKTKLSLQLFLMANFDRVNGPCMQHSFVC